MQHGAAPFLNSEDCPLLLAMARLSSQARAQLQQGLPCPCDEELCPCLLTRPIAFPEEDVAILRLLQSAVGAPPLPSHPEVVHPRLLTDGLVTPGKVPPLKQWARLRLRQALHEAWQLPEGVAMLSLPDPLKRYVNLEA